MILHSFYFCEVGGVFLTSRKHVLLPVLWKCSCSFQHATAARAAGWRLWCIKTSMIRWKGSWHGWKRIVRIEPGVRKREKDYALLHSCSAFYTVTDELVYITRYGACCKPWQCHSANKSMGRCVECMPLFSKAVSLFFLFFNVGLLFCLYNSAFRLLSLQPFPTFRSFLQWKVACGYWRSERMTECLLHF